MGRGGLGLRCRPACSDGCPSTACRVRGGRVGNGIAMVAPPLVHHSTVVPCFYGGLGFFHKHSWLWISLLPSLQAVSSQPTAVPSLGPLSKPRFPAPSPPPHQETHNSSWGAQGCGMDHVHRSYPVLPSTDLLLRSPLISQSPKGPSLSKLISPP